MVKQKLTSLKRRNIGSTQKSLLNKTGMLLVSILCIGGLIISGCDQPFKKIPPTVNDVSDLDNPIIRTKLLDAAMHESNLQVKLSPTGEKVYHKQRQDQPYTGWTKNNRKLQQYQDGKRHGIFISWYGNWQKAEQGQYNDSKRDGVWIQWSPIGKKENEGSYKDGRRDGLWTLWDSQGNIVREKTYKDGRILTPPRIKKKDDSTRTIDTHSTENFPVAYIQHNKKQGGYQNLSKGIKRRFGKGAIKDIDFSPDGRLLAVATVIGIWLYDGKTGEQIAFPDYIDSVRSIAFSPDGKILVSGSSNTYINLWDVDTGRQISQFKDAGSSVDEVQISPDGQMVLSVNVSKGIDLWDVYTGERKTRVTGNLISFSPVNDMYIAVHGKDITIYDSLTGQSIESVTLKNSGIQRLFFNPNGEIVAMHNMDNTVTLLNLFTKHEHKLLTALDKNEKHVLSFSPDGLILATASTDGTITLWDVNTGLQKQELTTADSLISSVKFSPEGSNLAAGNKIGEIHIWNIETGDRIKTLISPKTEIETIQYRNESRTITDILFNPDGTTLVSVIGKDVIQIWDLESGTSKKKHKGFYNIQLQSLAISPSHNIVASGGNDYAIRLWNTKTGNLMHTLFQGNLVSSLAFNKDGTTLTSGCWANRIRFWNPNTGQEYSQIEERDIEGIECIEYSPDFTLLAFGRTHGDIQLWDVSRKKLKSILKGHTSRVYSVAFSPDGKILASGEKDKKVKLWDVASGTLKNTLKGHTHYVSSVVFSSDGDTVISGSWDNTIRFWNAHTGEYIRNFTWDCIACLAISPDGNNLAASSVFSRQNKPVEIRLWDIETGLEKMTLSGHTGWIFEIEFSSDGKTLASSSNDGTVILWDLTNITDSPIGEE